MKKKIKKGYKQPKSKSLIKVSTMCKKKKGKLKGKNKKETQLLKDICPHHFLTKKGRVETRLTNLGDMKYKHPKPGVAKCVLCGTKFSLNPYTIQEVDDIVSAYVDLLNLTQYLSVEVNANGEITDMLGEECTRAREVKKIYKRINKITKKRNHIKKNKSKRQGSSQYGNLVSGGYGFKNPY